MKIEFENGRFVTRTLNQFHKHRLNAAGFYWCPINQEYYSTNVRAAIRLRDFLSDETKNLIKDFSLIKTLWDNRRPLFEPKGFKYRDNQIKAIEFSMTRNHSYIAYRMRLGKTAIAVGVANEMQSPLPVLVIAPPSIIPVWLKEFSKLFKRAFTHQIIHGKTDKIKADIILCPHSLLENKSISNLLKSNKYSLSIIDEAHRFKSGDSVRLKNLFGVKFEKGIVHKAEKIICLSGTPLMNRPIELYPLISRLAWNTLNYRDFYSFGSKYCAGHMVQYGHKKHFDTRGASNIEELEGKLKSFMLIDMKENEALPYKEYILPIGCPIPLDLFELEEKLRAKMSIEKIIGTKSLGGIAEYRLEMARAKIKPSIEVIESKILGGKKLLVLAWHKEIIFNLYEGLIKHGPLVIDGSTSMSARKMRCEMFQDRKNKTNKVMISQISTMEGVDLSMADAVYFVEYDWTPSRNKQALFRAIKVNKKKIVEVFYLVAKNTLDEYVLNVLKKKKNIINALTKENTNEQNEFNF